MKTITLINKAIVISALTALCCIASFAQYSTAGIQTGNRDTLGRELRPFDFTDKFYSINGINPALIIDRRTGEDGQSVFDFTSEENYSGVRILATRPAYAYDGSPIYWNFYGGFFKEAFLPGAAGDQARSVAESFPVYIFPSVTAKNQERQAALIEYREGYVDKNPLGLGIVMVVEYRGGRYNRDDAAFLAVLAKQNGQSLDGTPIIRMKREIDELVRRNLVTVRTRGGDTDPGVPPFVIAKVIQDPANGAIAPDAFLITVTENTGRPLTGESFFLRDFECYKGACAIEQ